ncbi:hypothetical protein [Archangium violaceum]|uniref:hypothetical protein n=1 Tax=Archangium violaceum TaxID=83451 RepID=UPI000697E48D|nr:hypothetical protein [Archangium violaceum]
MRRDYRDWLRSQGYDEGTINTQLSRVARLEAYYGELDGHYDRDHLGSLIEQMAYSVEDQRRSRPNPSKLPFVGNIRNNLASYKSAVLLYRRFRGSGTVVPSPPAPSQPSTAPPLLAVSESWPPRQTEPKSLVPRVGPQTLVDFTLDGRSALEAVIASSQYRTVAQAIASLSLFSHPQTVHQTGGKAIFPAIRNRRRVGQIDEHEGRRVLLDDNQSPTEAFLWANGLNRRGRDTQFNHVYDISLDADAYTALPNICMTPAFIAKLTDTNEQVCRLLRYRSYHLYQWVPSGHIPPERPEEYEALEWAAPLPPVEDVRSMLINAMASKPKNRTVRAARELGWLFG